MSKLAHIFAYLAVFSVMYFPNVYIWGQPKPISVVISALGAAVVMWFFTDERE